MMITDDGNANENVTDNINSRYLQIPTTSHLNVPKLAKT